MGRFSRSQIPSSRLGLGTVGALSAVEATLGENATKRYICIFTATLAAGAAVFTQGQTRLATIDFAVSYVLSGIATRASFTQDNPTIAGGTVTFLYATTATGRIYGLVIGRPDPLRILA